MPRTIPESALTSPLGLSSLDQTQAALEITTLMAGYFREQLYRDDKTGLFNLRGVEAHYDALLAADIPVAAHFFDVENFKRINDKYGHAIGDVVLKMTADCMQAEVRKTDSIPVRLGGDEFGILQDLRPNRDASLNYDQRAQIFGSRVLKRFSSCEGVQTYNGLFPEHPLGLRSGYAVNRDSAGNILGLIELLDRADPKGNPGSKLYSRQQIFSEQSAAKQFAAAIQHMKPDC